MKRVRGDDLEKLRAVAADAVESAMRVVAGWREHGTELGVRSLAAESVYDRYTTAVDDAAEAAIFRILRQSDPRIPAVGELPSGDTDAGRVWIVDPIDGTTNLVQGASFVGVTLALFADGEPLVAATGCPFTGELWTAAQGAGARDRAGRRLELRERPPEVRRVALDPAAPTTAQRVAWESARARTATACAEVIPVASIALALAYMAAGNFDGFVQLGGSPVSPGSWKLPSAAAQGGMQDPESRAEYERLRPEMLEQLAPATVGLTVKPGRKRRGRLVFGDATD